MRTGDQCLSKGEQEKPNHLVNNWNQNNYIADYWHLQSYTCLSPPIGESQDRDRSELGRADSEARSYKVNKSADASTGAGERLVCYVGLNTISYR